MSVQRVARILLGIILLGVFGYYVYMRNENMITTAALADLPIVEDEMPDEVLPAAPAALPQESKKPEESPPAPETIEPVDTPETPAAPDPNSPAGKALAKGLPAPPEIDINSWEFILANTENSIAEYAPPDLSYLGDTGCPVDSRIASALIDFAEDTMAQGLSVYLSSGYRSYSDQAANFTRVCQNNGISDGKDANGFYITFPAGYSEHQTGLCCDVTDIYYSVKNSSIENTATFQYMSQHCQDFGFILRYPKGKETITGVMYEPWHYRYVGVDVAKYIMENDLTFEEFVELYR